MPSRLSARGTLVRMLGVWVNTGQGASWNGTTGYGVGPIMGSRGGPGDSMAHLGSLHCGIFWCVMKTVSAHLGVEERLGWLTLTAPGRADG